MALQFARIMSGKIMKALSTHYILLFYILCGIMLVWAYRTFILFLLFAYCDLKYSSHYTITDNANHCRSNYINNVGCVKDKTTLVWSKQLTIISLLLSLSLSLSFIPLLSLSNPFKYWIIAVCNKAHLCHTH